MGRRRSRDDDSFVGAMIGLVRECIEFAGQLSPMKGLGLGILLAFGLCGVVPGLFHALASGPLIAKIVGVFGLFSQLVGTVGALGCFVMAGKNLVHNWQAEPKAGLQLAVILVVCIIFLGSLFSLMSSYLGVIAPAGTAPRMVSSGTSTGLTLTPAAVPARAEYVSPMFASNAYWVEFKYLQAGYKVVREARCEPYVDMVMAAQRAGGSDAKQRIAEAVSQGASAQCFVEKTPEEKLPYGLRSYWQNNSQRLRQTSECAKYTQWARETALTEDATAEDRQYQLTRLFADAQSHNCMQ